MTRLIGCQEAVRELWRYIDEELDAHDHGEVERHLQHCLHCCGELEFVRELRTRLTARPVELPADVRDRLDAFIDGIGAGGRHTWT